MSAIAIPPAARRSATVELARLIEIGRVQHIRQDQQPIDSSDGPQHPPRWGLSLLLGRLVEISGHGASAVLTVAMGLVREAQGLGEPVAWITPSGHSFFPPDAAAGGGLVRIEEGEGGRRELEHPETCELAFQDLAQLYARKVIGMCYGCLRANGSRRPLGWP